MHVVCVLSTSYERVGLRFHVQKLTAVEQEQSKVALREAALEAMAQALSKREAELRTREGLCAEREQVLFTVLPNVRGCSVVDDTVMPCALLYIGTCGASVSVGVSCGVSA